jgi:hypothetical protein
MYSDAMAEMDGVCRVRVTPYMRDTPIMYSMFDADMQTPGPFVCSLVTTVRDL